MRLASAITFVLATVLGAMQCHALIRVALFISDAGYRNAHVLPNPIDDARDVAELRMVIAADHQATAPLSAAEERVLKSDAGYENAHVLPNPIGALRCVPYSSAGPERLWRCAPASPLPYAGREARATDSPSRIVK